MPAAAAFQAGLCPSARLGLALRPAFMLLGFRGPSIRKACVLHTGTAVTGPAVRLEPSAMAATSVQRPSLTRRIGASSSKQSAS